jgi:hypothetical protein
MDKPGWKTTEFWIVVVAAVLSVAVAGGYVTPDQAVGIKDAVAQTIDAVTDLVGVLTPLVGLVTYVWSRTKVKTNGK